MSPQRVAEFERNPMIARLSSRYNPSKVLSIPSLTPVDPERRPRMYIIMAISSKRENALTKRVCLRRTKHDKRSEPRQSFTMKIVTSDSNVSHSLGLNETQQSYRQHINIQSLRQHLDISALQLLLVITNSDICGFELLKLGHSNHFVTVQKKDSLLSHCVDHLITTWLPFFKAEHVP